MNAQSFLACNRFGCDIVLSLQNDIASSPETLRKLKLDNIDVEHVNGIYYGIVWNAHLVHCSSILMKIFCTRTNGVRDCITTREVPLDKHTLTCMIENVLGICSLAASISIDVTYDTFDADHFAMLNELGEVKYSCGDVVLAHKRVGERILREWYEMIDYVPNIDAQPVLMLEISFTCEIGSLWANVYIQTTIDVDFGNKYQVIGGGYGMTTNDAREALAAAAAFVMCRVPTLDTISVKTLCGLKYSPNNIKMTSEEEERQKDFGLRIAEPILREVFSRYMKSIQLWMKN